MKSSFSTYIQCVLCIDPFVLFSGSLTHSLARIFYLVERWYIRFYNPLQFCIEATSYNIKNDSIIYRYGKVNMAWTVNKQQHHHQQQRKSENGIIWNESKGIFIMFNSWLWILVSVIVRTTIMRFDLWFTLSLSPPPFFFCYDIRRDCVSSNKKKKSAHSIPFSSLSHSQPFYCQFETFTP